RRAHDRRRGGRGDDAEAHASCRADSRVASRGAGMSASATKVRLTGEQRRQTVLDAACEVFFASSYRGATTAEIARRAGISEPILYRHFGSKRDLYLACLEEAWRGFRAFADEALESNPAGCLGQIADHYMAKRARLRLVDLWIQALTEAGDDSV